MAQESEKEMIICTSLMWLKLKKVKGLKNTQKSTLIELGYVSNVCVLAGVGDNRELSKTTVLVPCFWSPMNSSVIS